MPQGNVLEPIPIILFIVANSNVSIERTSVTHKLFADDLNCYIFIITRRNVNSILRNPNIGQMLNEIYESGTNKHSNYLNTLQVVFKYCYTKVLEHTIALNFNTKMAQQNFDCELIAKRVEEVIEFHTNSLRIIC